mmetsp:Transcript_29953/g.50651  ORF Transcript_29953/g.50651 Transcript_29953/m.50651 type:complete len:208 (-) Transcript_29953:631-1254(-)
MVRLHHRHRTAFVCFALACSCSVSSKLDVNFMKGQVISGFQINIHDNILATRGGCPAGSMWASHHCIQRTVNDGTIKAVPIQSRPCASTQLTDVCGIRVDAHNRLRGDLRGATSMVSRHAMPPTTTLCARGRQDLCRAVQESPSRVVPRHQLGLQGLREQRGPVARYGKPGVAHRHPAHAPACVRGLFRHAIPAYATTSQVSSSSSS